MEKFYLVLAILFALTSIVLAWRLILRRREMSRFAHELEKQKDLDYAQPLKVNSFSKDITDVAKTLNELSDIRRNEHIGYERARQEIGSVISGISHDLRTPLTASLGYLQMIGKSGELSDKNAEYLDIAMQKNRYLKELSDEFFELTKIENSKDELHLEEVNFSNLLTETLLEQHSWIDDNNIITDFDITDGIVIQADVHSLTRILNNLMSNAQKYTADSFSVTLKKESDRVIFRVSNNISDNSSFDIDRVFEPFYRMDARTAGGSGLGLYVVKFLCDRLMWTACAELKGNVFTVSIMI